MDADEFVARTKARLEAIGGDVDCVVVRWPRQMGRSGLRLSDDEALDAVGDAVRAVGGARAAAHFYGFDDAVVGVGERAVRYHRGFEVFTFRVSYDCHLETYVEDTFRRAGIPMSWELSMGKRHLFVPSFSRHTASRLLQDDPLLRACLSQSPYYTEWPLPDRRRVGVQIPSPPTRGEASSHRIARIVSPQVRPSKTELLAHFQAELAASDPACDEVTCTWPAEVIDEGKALPDDLVAHSLLDLAKGLGFHTYADLFRGVGERSIRFYRSSVPVLALPEGATLYECRLVADNLRAAWVPLHWDDSQHTFCVPKTHEEHARGVIAKEPFLRRYLRNR
jgi:hypothetical protein